MTKEASISIADLDVRTASETPFEFEYLLADGKGSGVFLQVLGAHSKTVQTETNRLVNDRRSAEAQREAMQIGIGAPAFTPVEDDIAFGQRLAAVRLVGWRGPGKTEGLTAEQVERFQGVKEPWSADLALKLCRSNPPLSEQVTKRSATLGNFTPTSAAP